jgi:hypothetical protein
MHIIKVNVALRSPSAEVDYADIVIVINQHIIWLKVTPNNIRRVENT